MTKNEARDWTAAVCVALMVAMIIIAFTAKMFGVNL
jgi:hypothetical protein